ncbi:hypothetical protein IEQ34_003480 [Dendrobium chrysotoxum]|uniref:Uncharacterized protein n=1 Tax=Dendrobium chrysotoxum TaxID=161865 RepID=A0AAV7HHS0_DENCH|nr:hypothetical protein IEQ34_003480 [Dendrobium chrysotoxum]
MLFSRITYYVDGLLICMLKQTPHFDHFEKPHVFNSVDAATNMPSRPSVARVLVVKMDVTSSIEKAI